MWVDLVDALIVGGVIRPPGARLELPDSHATGLLSHGHVIAVVPEAQVMTGPPARGVPSTSPTVTITRKGATK